MIGLFPNESRHMLPEPMFMLFNVYIFSGSSAGTNCPRGTFNDITGLTNSSSCEPCTPGYYCSQLGMSAVSGVCYAGIVLQIV